jgi:hypothetical protein
MRRLLLPTLGLLLPLAGPVWAQPMPPPFIAATAIPSGTSSQVYLASLAVRVG